MVRRNGGRYTLEAQRRSAPIDATHNNRTRLSDEWNPFMRNKAIPAFFLETFAVTRELNARKISRLQTATALL